MRSTSAISGASSGGPVSSQFGLDSAFETASTVSSKLNDQTLEFGDWTIMEPGKQLFSYGFLFSTAYSSVLSYFSYRYNYWSSS